MPQQQRTAAPPRQAPAASNPTPAPLTAKQKTARDVRGLLTKYEKQFAQVLPKHLTPERLMRVAMTAIQQTPGLLECTPLSLLGSVMRAAQLGLEPDGILGHAYLVPYKNSKTQRREAQLIVGYRGFIALARRSGEVTNVSAGVVYDKDRFEYSFGLQPKLEHTPAAASDRGKPTHFYAVAFFKAPGMQPAWDVMTKDEVDAVRARSMAKNAGPWVTDYVEMGKKTVVRRLAKYLPLSVEFQRAAAEDEHVELGLPILDPALEIVTEGGDQELAGSAGDAVAEDLQASIDSARRETSEAGSEAQADGAAGDPQGQAPSVPTEAGKASKAKKGAKDQAPAAGGYLPDEEERRAIEEQEAREANAGRLL